MLPFSHIVKTSNTIGEKRALSWTCVLGGCLCCDIGLCIVGLGRPPLSSSPPPVLRTSLLITDIPPVSFHVTYMDVVSQVIRPLSPALRFVGRNLMRRSG
ncbi:hypothetical protein GDO81_023794 [Engystomops pustulosus]|uniref:Uncharacterized protein n=1 Tax=Engystomops pustulosus TaxID=76066 RepID=A0AAV6YK54_ENGPU|nr:hypothetical protein GDO81_023794 [Engystomops pustulosus]